MTENTTALVDEANLGQFEAWDGDQGAFWAARADRIEEGVAGYHEEFFAAAGIEAGSNVLDIGCGSGRTTLDAARRATEGSALGVDLSSHLVDLARAVATTEGVTNAEFQQADAQIHPFPERRFDLALSRHGAMFFGDAKAAFTNIARATGTGGRLVLLTWQPFERNEFISAFRAALAAGRDLPVPPSDGQSPFSLSDPGRVRELLTSAGYVDVRLHAVHEPMYFGTDADDAFEFVSRQHAGLVKELDADATARAFDNLRASLAAHQTDRGVFYDSAAWLIEARRA
jgi:SAM-dependent methyltransferase